MCEKKILKKLRHNFFWKLQSSQGLAEHFCCSCAEIVLQSLALQNELI